MAAPKLTPARPPAGSSAATGDERVESPLSFADQAAWSAWLQAHHATSSGVWLRLAKKGADAPSVSYPQAVESALCFGWIDGRKKREDDRHWLQRFTPRTATSLWSRINCDKALRLIELGRMQAAGLREVARARADGRWDRAYDSPASADVPPDLQAELDRTPAAQAFFATLDSRNRYAVLFRIQTAKKAETRARRIRQFVDMLARHEKLHP